VHLSSLNGLGIPPPSSKRVFSHEGPYCVPSSLRCLERRHRAFGYSFTTWRKTLRSCSAPSIDATFGDDSVFVD